MRRAFRTAWDCLQFSIALGNEYWRTGAVCVPPAMLLGRLEEPYPFYARLRERSPVHRSAWVGGVILSRAADVAWALTDPRFTTDFIQSTAWRQAQTVAGNVRPAFSAVHTAPHERPLLVREDASRPAYRASLISALDSDARETFVAAAKSRIAAYVAGLPSNGLVDVMRELVLPLTQDLTLELLGVPHGGQERVREHLRDGLLFAFMHGESLARFPVGLGVARQCRSLRQSLRQTFRALADSGGEGAAHGVIPALLRATDRWGLTAEHALQLAEEALVASFEPPTCQLGNTLAALAARPELYGRLRRQPERIGDAVHELERFDPAVHAVFRFAVEDVPLGSEVMRAGEQVTLLLGSANRDPEAFQHPDTVDIDRSERRHFTFGRGEHACIGARITRTVQEMVLRALLERYRAFELTGRPTWRSSLPMRGPRRLPVRVAS